MGEPFDRSPMTNAPVNELGVMVLFGMVAAGLGLQVESVQGKFPDCMAKRQVAPGKWQYLRIEFEYESKNFKLHGHDPKGCDMIVCWRHNWKDCPAEIEVVELCRLFGMQLSPSELRKTRRKTGDLTAKDAEGAKEEIGRELTRRTRIKKQELSPQIYTEGRR